MKSILFSMLILCFSGLFAQTECSISDYYGDFLKAEKIKRGEREFIRRSVNQIETESCVKHLVNNNIQYIDYLLTHFITKGSQSDLVSIEDSIEIQQQFENQLKNDSLFNSIMTELADKTINNKLEKDSVFKNLSSEQYHLYEDFANFVRAIYTFNLGTENNEKLLRAQGALFMAMRKNSKLKEMLIDEYSEKKDFLPFKMYY